MRPPLADLDIRLNRELNNLSGKELAASRSSQVFTRDVERIGRECRAVSAGARAALKIEKSS